MSSSNGYFFFSFSVTFSDEYSYAHNGATKRIQLIDEFGCPVDDKLISRFRGSWSDSGIFETQVYAYMKTFRFTGSPALYIECDVRMCHGRCPVSKNPVNKHLKQPNHWFSQSQPCHWRNLKGVTKREAPSEPINSTLSDNISLFQSIRVLQDEDEPNVKGQSALSNEKAFSLKLVILIFKFIFAEKDPTETCVRTSVLSALFATCSMLFCILIGSLFVTCTKLRHRKNENPFFDSAYVGHKGQID